MNPCVASFYITSVACALFECLPEDELNVLAADLMELSDTLTAMQARADLCNKTNEKNDNNTKDTND